MPVFKWPREPIKIIQAFEGRRQGRGETGALIMWAAWTVEGLHYLDDLDTLHHKGSQSDKTHQPDVVNIAHVRWATGSAITALDLCAAALGREFCGLAGQRELDLRGFDPLLAGKDIPLRRAALSANSIAWVDSVLADARYKDVQGARNPLTHSRLKRRMYIDGPSHTEFFITATRNTLNTRNLVCRARDLATERVTEFLAVTESIP
jgi:hypothetical protein